MANVHFVGLAPQTAVQIERALSNKSYKIAMFSADAPAEKLRDADVIFATGDDLRYRHLLAEVRARDPKLPFIVVTRLPETRIWLDALEAGATDYCAEPIERKQLEWLMDSALGPKASRAAA